ncbi:MAG: hypothetical protein GY811_23275, partial [Myxococcales bacterium]|nr:hypothetical protein [Myxococcales bacterium]
GAVVWVGGLITAVSFQVVPMFYLTDPYLRWLRRGMLIGIAATATGLIAIVASSGSSDQVILAALPGALAVWLVHPLATLVLLRGKRRKRVDLSIRFWQVGLLCGPLVLGFATTTWLSDHPR